MRRMSSLGLAVFLCFGLVKTLFADCKGCAAMCADPAKKAACAFCRRKCGETQRRAAEQGLGLQAAGRSIEELQSELENLEQRERIGTQRCANIPADEPNPVQVAEECYLLKRELADEIKGVREQLAELVRARIALHTRQTRALQESITSNAAWFQKLVQQ